MQTAKTILTQRLQEMAGIKDDEICTRLKFGIPATTTVSWQSGIQQIPRIFDNESKTITVSLM